MLAKNATDKIAAIAARAAIGSSPVSHPDTRGTTYPANSTRAAAPASSDSPRPTWLDHQVLQRSRALLLPSECCCRVPELAKMSWPSTLAPPNSSTPAIATMATCASCEDSDHAASVPVISVPVSCAHHVAACPRSTHQRPAAPTPIPATARAGAGMGATDADNTAETGASARRSKPMPLPRALKAKHSRITHPAAPATPSPRVSTCKPHTPTAVNTAPTIPAPTPANSGAGTGAVGKVCVGSSSPRWRAEPSLSVSAIS
ncbi:Uncharacterised protein [Mycobacteroides abscessus subsp. abscessus]|nr:Uncharacterised protein [Mycobacteroides abscessus subsp. abscessus]SKX32596.1 Uncharacterised protein [Mycobacteroides abscessus subsp. abscessus]